MPAEPGPTFNVAVETAAWVNNFIDGSAAGTREHHVPAHPGDTVRDVLQRLTEGHSRLREALWAQDGRTLGEHIEVIVNDEVLGVVHTLDTAVEPTDRILLVGQFIGGR